MAEVIVAKHRNGALDSVGLKFMGKYTKFADHEQLMSYPESFPAQFDTITQASKANGPAPSSESPF